MVKVYFNLPPYPAAVAFVVALKREAAMAYYKKIFSLSGDMEIHDCRAVAVSADSNAHLIYLPKKPKTSRDFAALSHECVHVANRVLQQIGFKQCGWDNDEPQAYLQSYIFEQCLERLK